MTTLSQPVLADRERHFANLNALRAHLATLTETERDAIASVEVWYQASTATIILDRDQRIRDDADHEIMGTVADYKPRKKFDYYLFLSSPARGNVVDGDVEYTWQARQAQPNREERLALLAGQADTVCYIQVRAVLPGRERADLHYRGDAFGRVYDERSFECVVLLALQRALESRDTAEGYEDLTPFEADHP